MTMKISSAEEANLFRRLEAIGNNDARVLIEKGRSYGDSWKKRGGVGAFMMLARKWDRIEQQVLAHGYDIFAAAGHDGRLDGIMDDVRDLRRYLALVDQEVCRDFWSEMATAEAIRRWGIEDEEAQSMREHAASIKSQHED